MHKLHAKNVNNIDSIIIAELIDKAVKRSSTALSCTVQHMPSGCFVTLFKGRGHNAHWTIDWSIYDPHKLDTGVSPIINLCDPTIEDKLTKQIIDINNLMTGFCDCNQCFKAASDLSSVDVKDGLIQF